MNLVQAQAVGVLFLVGLVVSNSFSAVEEGVLAPNLKVYRSEGWSIVAPVAWRELPGLAMGQRELYINGDGKVGVPLLDDHLSPIKLGMSVQVFPPESGSQQETMKELIGSFKSDKTYALREELLNTEITLADGIEAQVFGVEFDRLDNGRLSFVYNLVCETPEKKVVVVSGWLSCGKASHNFATKSGLVAMLYSQVISLVQTEETIDTGAVEKAWSEIDSNLFSAVVKMSVANKLIGTNDRKAVRLFRESLKVSDLFAVAHNGLGWILITSEDQDLYDLENGLLHAGKAVELTGRQNSASLDTLALALFKCGDDVGARKAIKEAIAMSPDDDFLRLRLREFEGGHRVNE